MVCFDLTSSRSICRYGVEVMVMVVVYDLPLMDPYSHLGIIV